MMRIVCRVLMSIGAVQLCGCGSASVNELPADGLLTIGTWGGDSAGVIVTDTLTHVHIGCTYGDIRGRVSLYADGRFARAGSYLLRAYPVAIGPTMPAQFTGRLSGSILTISVTVRDTVARTDVVLGPVSTRLGQPHTAAGELPHLRDAGCARIGAARCAERCVARPPHASVGRRHAIGSPAGRGRRRSCW